MKKFIFHMIRLSGLPYLFREVIQKNGITILLLHDINKTEAEMVFSYLSKKYNIIDLNTVIDAIENQDSSKLPKKAMVLTFDDGHIGNYELLELIQLYNINITIFLCAGIIGTHRHFWWKTDIDEHMSDSIKKMTNEARLHILSEGGFNQYKQYDSPQALGNEQIEKMKPQVNFQSHTMFHPCLPMCTSEVARWEIFESKKILEQEFGLKINAFSYPNGDYSGRDLALVREAGYRCAITVDYGINNLASNPFALKRISINDTDDIDELIVKSSGLWGFVKTINGKLRPHRYNKSVL